MSKRGTTLIETVAAIFVISVALVTFLEGLNVAITGTLELNRKTSALSLAKSQIEYIKAVMPYNASAGNLSYVYGAPITTGTNISDTVNYNISGTVSNVSVNQSLQAITVNVSYFRGKQVQITGYRIADGSLMNASSRGLLVTDNIKDVPTLPNGYSFLCLGQYKGYYHVFTTGTSGPASMSWTFHWTRVSSSWDLGAPMMAIYSGIPSWASRDYLGVVRTDGIVVRNQNEGLGGLIGIGDLPGPGDGGMCDCCSGGGGPSDDSYCNGEDNPLYWAPHHHWSIWCWLFYDGQYPCCGLSASGGEILWTYDSSGSSGNVSTTLTTTANLSAGTPYTALFFNGENSISLDTISASVNYYK